MDKDKPRGVKNAENKPEEEKVEKKKLKPFKVGSEVILPYLGKDSLPDAILNKKGDLVKPGEPRHFVTRQGEVYKLIRVYRARLAIKHSLVRMIKPNKRNKPEEKAFFQELKKREIPGTQ